MRFVSIVIALSLLGLGGCKKNVGLGSGEGKVLAKVGSTKITEGDLNFLGTINPRLKAQAANPFGQKQIVDNLVEQELLFQESVKRGLDNDATVKAKADLYRRVIVAQAALDDEMEKAARKHFDEHKDEFEKLEMSHVLIRFKGADAGDKEQPKAPETTTRPEAQALALANQVKARLDTGEAFAKVAKEVSEDPGSKNAGGMVGKVWKQEPRLERRGYGPLLEKAFTLKVGEIAGPIKTTEGYHIITVTKGVEAQNFDDAKQAIFFKLQGDLRNTFLTDLKQKAKVEYAEGLEEPKKPNESKPEGDAHPSAEGPGTPSAQPTPEQPTPPAPEKPAPKK